jgi:capsular exopolysaccharide synthesis family protein
VDLTHALALLRRRWRPIAICLIAGLLGATFATSRQQKTYVSSARLFVNIPTASSVAEQVAGVQLSSQLLASYSRIATSRAVADRIVKSLSLNESPDAIRGRVGASPDADTLLLIVSASDAEPTKAARLANAAAQALIAQIDELEAGKSSRVRAQVIDDAQPDFTPVTPRPKVNLLVGGFLGLVVGLAVALVIDAMDRTVKTPVQAGELFRTPLLGLAPRAKAARESALELADDQLNAVGEAYRALRTSIRFVDFERPLKSILVTSPVAGEGKTTTALNLAVAVAKGGERVILVDADLRRSSLGEVLSIEPGVGLTSVVTRRVALIDALQDWRGLLTVLPCGALPPNPSELLGSQRMADLLRELEGMADLVVVDAPPVLPVTDAVVLATLVQGVLLVGRYGATQRSQAVEARRRLDGVTANVVGCFLNAVPPSAASGYYDDYYQPHQPPPGRNFGRRWTDRMGAR